MASFPEKEGGILLLNKGKGKTSFSLVSSLRKISGIKKIGHAGTLDPFAEGVMVLLIGKHFTRLSERFLSQDKEYHAMLHLGVATDTYDLDGAITSRSDKIPSRSEIENALAAFQGTISQIPPMFSAKKIKGKKLYELARKGIEVERAPVSITLSTHLLSYEYPLLELHIACSKGTYIRSIAHDIGLLLGSGAHLCTLTRTRVGPFHLKDCVDQASLLDPNFSYQTHLLPACR